MDYNLLDQQFVTQLISELEGSENLQRRINSWTAYRVSKGDVLPYVTQEVKRILPQSYKQMKMADISVSQKVIEKLSQAYKEKPIRRIEDDESGSELLSETYTEMNADEKFAELDFIYNLNRYAMMWVNYREDVGLQLVPLFPFEFDCVRNSGTGELEIVILNYPDSQITGSTPYNSWDQPDGINQTISNQQADSNSNTKTYAIWTKDQHISVRANTKSLPNGKAQSEITYFDIPGNPSNINPLGILPFVYIASDGNNTDYPVLNPLTRQTIFYNVLTTDLISAASLQGYGIRILSGSNEILNNIQKLHEGLTTAVTLPQPDSPDQARTTLTYEKPSPDLSGQKATYDYYLFQVLSQHGINPASSISGQGEKYTSGLDRVIATADVYNIVSKNQKTYTNLEKRVFDIVASWNDITGDTKFNPDSELNIFYPRPQILISDKETLENIKMRMDMGLIEPWQAMQILDPNLTEDEAKEKLASIKSTQDKAVQSFKGKDPNQIDLEDMIKEKKVGDI